MGDEGRVRPIRAEITTELAKRNAEDAAASRFTAHMAAMEAEHATVSVERVLEVTRLLESVERELIARGRQLVDVERKLDRLMPLADLFERVAAAGEGGEAPSVFKVLAALRGQG